jgi:carbamoyl-phosphate synthase large subunit
MSKKHLRILFTSAGRRVELLRCFRHAANSLDMDLDVLACDLNPSMSSACHAADQAFDVPHCSDPGYANVVFNIARKHSVHLVVPTIDPELQPLAVAAEHFSSNGIRVHVSPPSVVAVAQDKLKTAQLLGAAGVSVPATYSLEDTRSLPLGLKWPMFMKPKAGSASRGLQIIQSADHLPSQTDEPMLLQEFLRGPEYTVNIFIDMAGVLRSAVMHRRLQVRAGEVEKGRTERREDLHKLAGLIGKALPDARGVLCFQVIDDQDLGPQVIEINARFGGGYPLADHAGATFAQWLMEEVAGLPCTANNEWRNNVTMLRYDAAIFNG